MEQIQKFWLVWNPEGQTPPRVRHATFIEAKNEAYRLAALNPGKEYYILKTKGFEKRPSPVERQAALDEINANLGKIGQYKNATEIKQAEKVSLAEFDRLWDKLVTDLLSDMTDNLWAIMNKEPEPKCKPYPKYLFPVTPPEMEQWLKDTHASLKRAKMPWGFWPQYMTELPRKHGEEPAVPHCNRRFMPARLARNIPCACKACVEYDGKEPIDMRGAGATEVEMRHREALKKLTCREAVKQLVSEGRCMAVHYADKFTVVGINTVNLPEGACIDEIVKTIKLEDPQTIVMVFGKKMDAKVYPADDLPKFMAEVPNKSQPQPMPTVLSPLYKAVRDVIYAEQGAGFNLHDGVIVLKGTAEEYGLPPLERGVRCMGRSIIFAGDIGQRRGFTPPTAPAEPKPLEWPNRSNPFKEVMTKQEAERVNDLAEAGRAVKVVVEPTCQAKMPLLMAPGCDGKGSCKSCKVAYCRMCSQFTNWQG